MKALRRIILIVSVVIFIGSCGLLLKLLFIDPYLADRSSNKVNQIYYEQSDNNIEKRNFTSLLEMNSDVSGWINIPNTIIDYPVVYPKDEEYDFYLTHNFEKEYSRYGSIFIDSSCVQGTSSKNIIIHGHHMRDGRMFANLTKFSNLDFYRASPIITFDTPSENMKWKIISIFKTNTRPEQGEIFNYIVPRFKDTQKFLEFVYNLKIRSIIDIPVDVNENDQLITLSTCSYEFDDFRTVVVARKIRRDEKEYLDVNNTSYTANPLMPQCWYDRNGGERPIYPPFTEEFKSGNIKWYDGKIYKHS